LGTQSTVLILVIERLVSQPPLFASCVLVIFDTPVLLHREVQHCAYLRHFSKKFALQFKRGSTLITSAAEPKHL
jgi:hypothetical protein